MIELSNKAKNGSFDEQDVALCTAIGSRLGSILDHGQVHYPSKHTTGRLIWGIRLVNCFRTTSGAQNSL